ncbi:hypothetical protein VDG1235_1247 [Verrucomicrobiia bacterium DG1235]|nr:hypothetical protein VDG1235_1247 [Verrucomicrobiae bacterium DG1235]
MGVFLFERCWCPCRITISSIFSFWFDLQFVFLLGRIGEMLGSRSSSSGDFFSVVGFLLPDSFRFWIVAEISKFFPSGRLRLK